MTSKSYAVKYTLLKAVSPAVKTEDSNQKTYWESLIVDVQPSTSVC
jgi:hypothetical protein